MNQLIFEKNLNQKLDCDFFTTIRKKSLGVGVSYEIICEDVHICNAQVIEEKVFRIKDINEFIARLDSGLSAKELKEKLSEWYKELNDQSIVFFSLLGKVSEIPVVSNSGQPKTYATSH